MNLKKLTLIRIVLFALSLLLLAFFQLNAQNDTSTEMFRNDLKRLISINTGLSYTTFNNPEGQRIESVVPAQVIEIVPQFLKNYDPVAKKVCWSILGRAVLQKTNTLAQRRAIVEILCHFYLENNEDLQTIDNILIQLYAEDFNEASKKYISKLLDDGFKFYLTEAVYVVAVAQLKEKIPTLWTLAKKDITTMTRSEANILAALARLGENQAAELLCQYYQLERMKPDPKGLIKGYSVTMATALAFALHPVTLNCLIMDFQKIDIDEKERGDDYFWCPADFLGEEISHMLKHYPYKKDYSFDRYQLKDWLKTNPDLEIADK